MTKRDKIQTILITTLLEEGQVQLLLPSGMVLEIGITQENKNGELVKTDDYCWLIASQAERDVSIDSYNVGLRFCDDGSKILFEDCVVDREGKPTRSVAVA